MRDHPVIENLERTGYPNGKEPEQPHCTVCGEECDRIFFNQWGDIVGCENCVSEKDAYEVDECFPRKEDDSDECKDY